MQYTDIRQMCIEELKRLNDAEEQIVEQLPKMRQMASSPRLRTIFTDHLEDNDVQQDRIQKMFQLLGSSPSSRRNKAVRELFDELDDIDADEGPADVIDAKLIDVARKIELYEVAAYGTLSDYAERLGQLKLAELLHETMHEATRAAEKLGQAAQEAVFVR